MISKRVGPEQAFDRSKGVKMAWIKHKISSERYEAAAVFDVNGDGIPDIVSGAYWYAGPDFAEKYKICDVQAEGEYFDDFSDVGLDVNGDGRLDIVTGGWFGRTLRWRENPGTTGPWTVHDIDECGCIETIRLFDIDGCGTPEIFPNTPGNPQACYKLLQDGNGRGRGLFRRHVLYDAPSGHGMGFADVDGDGRVDLLLANGWLRQPDAGPWSGPWDFHPEYDCGFSAASVPILGHDVNGDGRTDLIVGHAHGYGLAWLEQQGTESGGRRFVRHVIDGDHAQFHDLQLADVDGDGMLELVTGKRWRAHCGGDPGDNDDVFIYCYRIDGGRFTREVIDEGPAGSGEHSGVGIWFALADLAGRGRLDLVAPGKEGLFWFENVPDPISVAGHGTEPPLREREGRMDRCNLFDWP